ncbi:MAG TPA: 5'-3' exonuclease H3TH domain-containing protein [Candidatus Pacearchaeota archaeon]|nr:5'-3' exonuclease H3TH domain-containing protein [Candidatus Pacearchaeota archaeon]
MEKIIIIDSNSVIHRAFHALPPLKNKKGEVVNAVYGYLTFLFKAIRELEPDYIAACFDVSKCTFRREMFEEYKAKRQKAPDELYSQIPLVKEVLRKFNIAIFEKEGYEGDDLIGTISKKENGNLEKLILSGDLDNLQLINENVKVVFLGNKVNTLNIYNIKKVEEKYELHPDQIVDFKALRGDASDNIPGVSGIGEKTAISLLKEFGDLENIYNNIDLIKGKIKEKLIEEKEKAYLSKELARILTNVEFEFDINKCKWGDFEKEEVIEMFEEFGFKSLIPKIPGGSKGDNLKLF